MLQCSKCGTLLPDLEERPINGHHTCLQCGAVFEPTDTKRKLRKERWWGIFAGAFFAGFFAVLPASFFLEFNPLPERSDNIDEVIFVSFFVLPATLLGGILVYRHYKKIDERFRKRLRARGRT